MKVSLRIVLIICFGLVTILLLNKDGILELASDIIDFMLIVPIWLGCSAVILYVIKFFTKRSFSERTKVIYFTIVGGVSLFHWTLIKYDSRPYDGPIDSILKKDIIQNSAIRDSLEAANGKPDSTIEYTYSIDTTKDGVYIWINGKTRLLRKLTEEERKGGQMREDLDEEAVINLR